MSNADVVISRTDILGAADSIEALPASVTKLLEIIGDDDFSMNEIVEVVKLDTALAGDVLIRANSAASGAIRQIADLQEAASRVGASTVVEIALRRAMRDRYASPIPAYGLEPAELWHHSLVASIAAEKIRRVASAAVPQMVSTAALVHDVGKVVIAKLLPEGMTNSLLAVADAQSMPLHEAEREVLGLDHGEVSGVVVRAWGLPLSVQIGLTQHHQESTGDPFNDALVLADLIAHAVMALTNAPDLSDEDFAHELDEQSAAILRNGAVRMTSCGIDPAKVAGLVGDSYEAAGEALSTLSS